MTRWFLLFSVQCARHNISSSVKNSAQWETLIIIWTHITFWMKKYWFVQKSGTPGHGESQSFRCINKWEQHCRPFNLITFSWLQINLSFGLGICVFRFLRRTIRNEKIKDRLLYCDYFRNSNYVGNSTRNQLATLIKWENLKDCMLGCRT